MSLHLSAVGTWPLKDPEMAFTYMDSIFGVHLYLGFKVCVLDTSSPSTVPVWFVTKS